MEMENLFNSCGLWITIINRYNFIEIMRKTSWSCTRGCKHFKDIGSIPISLIYTSF